MTKSEKADMRQLMNTNVGRRVMYRQLTLCRLYETSYNPALPVDNTVFNEGIRNVGLRLVSELQEAAPESFNLMMQENQLVDNSVDKPVDNMDNDD